MTFSLFVIAALVLSAQGSLLPRRPEVPEGAIAKRSIPKAEYTVHVGRKYKKGKKTNHKALKRSGSGTTALVGGYGDSEYVVPVTIGNQSLFVMMDTGT
jgi:hypothetical protein